MVLVIADSNIRCSDDRRAPSPYRAEEGAALQARAIRYAPCLSSNNGVFPGRGRSESAVGLLTKTNLAVPNWARPTASKDEKGTSLMSGGFEVLRQHHITLWEVLAEMTKTDVPETNWKV